MSTLTIPGVVANGVVVPGSPLPEGAQVDISLKASAVEPRPVAGTCVTPGELRKMPREARQAILARAAALAESDYRDDKDLTDFVAFNEEETDGDESETR